MYAACPVPADDGIAGALAANRIVPARPTPPAAAPRRPRPPLVLIDPLRPGSGLRVPRAGGGTGPAPRGGTMARARDNRAGPDRRIPMRAATD